MTRKDAPKQAKEVTVVLDGDYDFLNIAKHGEKADIRKAGSVVTLDAEFAQQLIESKYASKVTD